VHKKILSVVLLPLTFTAVAAKGATPPVVAPDYGKLPLSFEANQGQTDPQVRFTSRGNGYPRLTLAETQ
jgi:hypothetical protein